MGERRYENPQTTNLHRILNSTIEIQRVMADRKAAEEEEGKKGEGQSRAGESREEGASSARGKEGGDKEQERRMVSGSVMSCDWCGELL